MPRTPIGETRESVYRFVAQRLTRGEPPSLREIQEQFGFRAIETAREHLSGLVSEGRLLHEPGRSRSYRLPSSIPAEQFVTPSSRRLSAAALRGKYISHTLQVPLLGRVQAGALVTAVEEYEGFVPVQARSEHDELFALRVRGESMRDAGILPGDIVIVRREATAQNGDIVVALVDDEATVKRLRKGKRGSIELHPANPAFEVIVRPAKAVLLLGKVIEVRRYLDGEAH